MYQKAVNQQYAVSVSGGSANLAWLLSAGYDRNLNEINAKFDRFNFRFANTIKLSDRLKLDAAVYFTKTNSSSGRTGYHELINNKGGGIYPYFQLTDAAGNALPFYKDYRQTYIDTAGGGKLLDWKYYPLTDDQYQTIKTEVLGIIANAGLEYTIVAGITAGVRYQFEQQQTEGISNYSINSYFTRNEINRFSQIDLGTNTLKTIIPKGDIRHLSENKLLSQNLRGQFSFLKTFSLHSINALAGAEIRSIKTTGNSHTLYGYNENILGFSDMDYVTPYPTYITGFEERISSRISLTDRINHFFSLFGNIAYTYNDRYTVYSSIRRDASNLFGVQTNDKWTPLWSAGIGWQVSKEPFYNISFLPNLKFRSSYGFSGNADLSRSAVTTIQYNRANFLTRLINASVSQFPNPDLRWEKIKMFNIGLDFSFKNNRVSGTIDYYQKKGVDLFGEALLDYTTGLSRPTITKNVASMKGNGIDIALQLININKSVKWYTTINFSYAANKVLDYYIPDATGRSLVKEGSSQVIWKGKSLYSLYSYRWAGLDALTGDPQGFLNGQVMKDYNSLVTPSSPDDLIYNGLSLPPFFGNISNTLSWKGVSVTANIIYKLGYYFRNESISYENLYNRTAGHSDFANRWQQPGDEQSTHVPSMVYPLPSNRDQFYLYNEVLVEKADHIRLQFINLSYDIDKTLWRRLPVKHIQFYIVGSNLGILWRANKNKIDPDYKLSAFPPAKSFTIGIKCAL